MSDGKAVKKALRQKFSAARKSLSMVERMVLNGSVCSAIAALKEFAEADLVIAYASDGIEADVRGIIELALQNGKSVALPRYNPERKLYELVLITDFLRDTAPGKYGLPEPHKELPAATVGAKSLWLIPAVAFDKNGTRLGRGGGFYDRMLEGAPGIRVGVFYQCQYSDEALPCEEHDQKLTMAVTEKNVYRF